MVVVEYYDYLYRIALYYTRNREDAEDLVQDTFEHALKGNYYEKNKKAWLITILKHRYIDNLRKKKDIQYIPETVTYNDCFYIFTKQDIIRESKDLRIEEKKVLWMLLKGFKYEEISENLGMKIGTVKAKIFRIRQKLNNLNESNRHNTKIISKYQEQ